MYEQMREVYEGLRLFCVDRHIWGWSASQTKRVAGLKGELSAVLDFQKGMDGEQQALRAPGEGRCLVSPEARARALACVGARHRQRQAWGLHPLGL